MFRKVRSIFFILLDLHISSVDAYGQSNLINNMKMIDTPINKSMNMNVNSCVGKAGAYGTHVNGQQVSSANFQTDPLYYKSPSNPLECIQKVNQNFQKAKTAASETFNKVINSESKNQENCTYSMDKKANNCFITKYLDQIVKHPMWNIVLHDNVIQIFFGSRLRKMIIFENFNYIIKNPVKNCVTRFKDATAIAKHNAFGSVLGVIGDIVKKKKLECTPCGMKMQNSGNSNKSIDGQSDACSSCDPFTNLMGYQSSITEVKVTKPEKLKNENKRKKTPKK